MSVRERLILTLAVIACLVAVPAVYGLSRLATIRDIAHELQGRHAEARIALGGLESALRQLDRRQRSYLAAPDSASRVAMWSPLERAMAELERLEEARYGEEVRGTAKALRELELRTGELERAMEREGVLAATDFFFAQVSPASEAVHGTLEGVAAAIDERGAVAAARASDIGDSATFWVLTALLAALVLALILGSLLTADLVRPLRQLQRAMAVVAQGKLETPAELSYARADELGELNRSFRSMTEQLGELTRQRAEFVSIVTHDLKTPINVIAGYAELLREALWNELSSDDRAALSAIEEQAEALLKEVQHLLNLSRLEAGAFRLAPEPIHLADLCTGLRRGFEALAAQRKVQFSVEVEPSAPERITADMDRLRSEVLGNLIGNAFKFTPAGGRIGVRIFGEAGEAVIEVTDTGIGIPAGELPHIFERYYQGREGTRSSGVGLGLAIAREMVEAHGGAIRALSRPGQGTSFQVRLPGTPVPLLPAPPAEDGTPFREAPSDGQVRAAEGGSTRGAAEATEGAGAAVTEELVPSTRIRASRPASAGAA